VLTANSYFDALSKKDFDSVKEEIGISFTLLLPMPIGITSSLCSLRLSLFFAVKFLPQSFYRKGR